MIKLTRTWTAVGSRAVVSAIVILTMTQPVRGQDEATGTTISGGDESTTPVLDLRLDIESMVSSQGEFFPDAIPDPVWKVGVRRGRMLIQVPLRVEPSERAVQLGPSTLKLSRCRFVAWRLAPPGTAAADGSGESRHRTEGGPSGGAVPPRLAKKLTIHPDGKVSWSIKGKIYGAAPKGGDNLYALRLSSELLRKRQPTRLSLRSQSGEDRQVVVRRRDEFKRKQVAYQQLRREVRALPTDFEEQLPPRLWAIFDAPDVLKHFSIDGVKPGGWSIDLDLFRQLRLMATGQLQDRSRTKAGLSPQMLEAVEQIADLVKPDSHPYTLRFVAHSLKLSGVMGRTEPFGPLFVVLQNLLAAPDTAARRTVVEELASTQPRTQALENLLRLALRDLDPEVQLAALQGTLRANTNDPAQVDQMLVVADRFLNTESGVQPQQILVLLLDKARQAPKVGDRMISRIRFGRLAGERLDAAIVHVLAEAPRDRVATGWLDQQLLGSSQSSQVHRTLQLLDMAESGRLMVQPVIHHLLNLLLGPVQTGDEASGSPRLTLSGQILVSSSSHSIFRAIQSGDPKTRLLAWQVLRHFVFPGPVDKGGGSADYTNPYSTLVDAAVGLDTTPAEAAQFLARQPNLERATDGLVTLVLRGSRDASTAAGRLLQDSDRPINRALKRLTFDERCNFANAMYVINQLSPPLVIPLIGHVSSDERIVDWFGQQIKEGTLPESSTWAKPFGGEQRLLDVVMGDDEKLVQAAVAALVAVAGGDDGQVGEIMTGLRSGQSRTRAGLTAAWSEQRRKIYLHRINQIAGQHTLELRLFHADRKTGPVPPVVRPGPGPGFGPEPGFRPKSGFGPRFGIGGAAPEIGSRSPDQTFDLGKVDLQVNGDQVSFGSTAVNLSVPDKHLAVRFDNPSELKDLSNREVRSLPLDQIHGAIDLLPEKRGVWRGTAGLPDGAMIELIMKPVNYSATDSS